MTWLCASRVKELTLTSSCHPPPNDMMYSITPTHRHVHKHIIYKFICLSAMSLKYLLCTSCIGCKPIHYDIQIVFTVHKREVIHFSSQSCAWLSTQTKNVHINCKCAYVFQGEDGSWCLPNIKITRMQKGRALSVCYCAFVVDYCLLSYILFTWAEEW